MSNERNLAVARRWYEELWSLPDLAAADEIVAPDYAPDWIHIDAQGPAQVVHEIQYFRSIFPDLKYEILDAVATDDKVWVRYRGAGTQKGDAWGFKSTGRKVSFEGMTILQINDDGQVTDRWGAFSFYDILADLGLVPPLWELSERLGAG